MLEVNGLNFFYGATQVLHDINFDVEDGSMVSILGPNGVGKTTLLKCLCNLHHPRAGEIFFNDLQLNGLQQGELAKIIGYVPQSSRASHTTVFDSTLIGRMPHIDWSVTEKDKEIVRKTLKMMKLTELSLKYTDEISGGEMQKVQIARAIVQEPKIMILDEPTNNLDISNQHITMHMISDIIKNRGITGIMTMHDLNLAMYFSNKLMFVKNGRIVSYGGLETVTPELVWDVYSIDVDIIDYNGIPFVIPKKEQPNIQSYF